jgi:phytoene/squalene synthetase
MGGNIPAVSVADWIAMRLSAQCHQALIDAQAVVASVAEVLERELPAHADLLEYIQNVAGTVCDLARVVETLALESESRHP